jgi:predicted nucleic acid-binding protein
MILTDTSVWIDCFRNDSSAIAQFIREKIINDEIVYSGIIMAELLQGCKTIKEYNSMKSALSILPFVEFDFNTWEKGSEIAFEMRKQGYNLPITDCLIAALCLQHNFELLTFDKHFIAIAGKFPLKLMKFVL